MSRELLNEISVAPINFFSLTLPVYEGGHPLKRKHLLPDTHSLCDDYTTLAEVSLGWSAEGIAIRIAPKKNLLPKIELFFDTRAIKSAIFNHKFCHHFLFESNEEGAVAGREITRFRTDDSHALCDAEELAIEQEKSQIAIFIPSHCLQGYDPQQFNRLGFTYRISYDEEVSQHFAINGAEFAIDQNPSLWATLQLK